MKRIFISLISMLLVVSTLFLCACGEGETSVVTPSPDTPVVTPNPDVPDSSTTDNLFFDPSLPMDDPISNVLTALYNRTDLLEQPGEALFQQKSHEATNMLNQLAEAVDIINRGRPEVPIYGLYAFTHEYAETQDDITRVGFTNIRTTRETTYDSTLDCNVFAMTDQDMMNFCESDISVMFTVGYGVINGSRSAFLPARYGISYPGYSELFGDITLYDIASYLRRAVQSTFDLLDRYGPRGTFFEQHPNVNYNPLRYIEIYNEPNFQYLVPVKRLDGLDDANHDIKLWLYALQHVVVSAAVRARYNDEVKIVGLSVGGGADDVGQDYVRRVLALTGDAWLTRTLNDALDPDKLVQMKDRAITVNIKDTSTGKITQSTDYTINETDAEFAKRQSDVAQLRTWLNLADGEQIEIDMVGSMDILSTHPYIDDLSPFGSTVHSTSQSSYLKSTRDALVQYALDGDKERAANMPIWFTECGWSIKGKNSYALAYPEDDANGIKGGMAYDDGTGWGGTSQIIQAAMEVQDYLYGIRNGVDRITYMHLYDTDGCNFGLINYGYKWGGDRTWRLTLYAIQNMIDILPNPALKHVVLEDISKKTVVLKRDENGNPLKTESRYVGTYIYEIEADVGGEIVTTVLSPLCAQEGLKVNWNEDYALVTDMFGKSQIVKAVNGQITVDAGPYLLYIRQVPRDMLFSHGYLVSAPAVAHVELFGQAWNTHDENI